MSSTWTSGRHGVGFLPICRRRSVESLVHPVVLRNNRAGGVDVGHHLVGVLVAVVAVVALGELKIGGGEFLGGIDRASTPSRLNSAKASSRSNLSSAAALKMLSI